MVSKSELDSSLKMKQQVLVSVVMITYNHENYIEEAVNGVLMQKTDFAYELIVANDQSTDQTDSVIKRILSEHPLSSRVHYIEREKNMGMIANFIGTVRQSKGKYIALCEGDDYWTDPFKLQKQVDFLEQNEEYSLVCHDAQIIDEVSGKTYRDFTSPDQKQICSTKDLFGSNFCTTASILFRKESISSFELPEFKVLTGDLFLKLLVSLDGLLFRMYEVMSVHRITATGATMTLKRNMPELIRSRILLFDYFNKVSGKKFDKYLRIEILLLKSYLDHLNSKSFVKTVLLKVYMKTLFIKRKRVFRN